MKAEAIKTGGGRWRDGSVTKSKQALTVLPKDRASIPSNHIAAHTCPKGSDTFILMHIKKEKKERKKTVCVTEPEN